MHSHPINIFYIHHSHIGHQLGNKNRSYLPPLNVKTIYAFSFRILVVKVIFSDRSAYIWIVIVGDDFFKKFYKKTKETFQLPIPSQMLNKKG